VHLDDIAAGNVGSDRPITVTLRSFAVSPVQCSLNMFVTRCDELTFTKRQVTFPDVYLFVCLLLE